MLEEVVWIERVNVSVVSDNALKKTGGCDGCLDAGASSQQSTPNANGYFEFTVSETDKVRYIGLNPSSTTVLPTDIVFGVRIVNGRAEIKESGHYRGDIPVATGDVIRIASQSGVITYAKNGTVFYTSAETTTFPLYVDTSFINMGATLTNVRIAVAAPDDDGDDSSELRSISSSSPATAAVSWTDPVNVTASGSSLQKTGGCDGCQDSGAVSQQQVNSGNASLDFTVSETGPMFYVGLNTNSTGTGAAEIPFAFKLLNNSAEVRENDLLRANIAIGSGDVLRIAVKGGIVNYAKNGTVFYTSGTRASYPLRVDTSFISSGSTLSNARVTGFSTTE